MRIYSGTSFLDEGSRKQTLLFNRLRGKVSYQKVALSTLAIRVGR
jgi:hypothetical protein